MQKFEVGENYSKSKKFPQHVAALTVCLGSLATGTALGWTGNITRDLLNKKLNGIDIDQDVLGWLSSFTNLGAMMVCFPMGYVVTCFGVIHKLCNTPKGEEIVCDLIGRKWACLLTMLPFLLGWLLIIFAYGPLMIYCGRFLIGTGGGAICVAAPIYTSEISEKEIRGTLGSYFQLMLVIGILFSYIFGSCYNPMQLSLFCAFVPLVFGMLFLYQPETPVYCLKNDNKDKAIQSLKKLRGKKYDCESEIREIQEQLNNEECTKIPFLQAIHTKAAKKAIVICFGLMFFNQLSGINAILFFSGKIFDSGGGSIPPNRATIIIGVVQVISTFVSTMVVDSFGRKPLLIVSGFCMALSGAILGVFFTFKERNLLEGHNLRVAGFLPIVSIVFFITVWSLGFGPIHWMASAEIMPPEIKSTAVSATATFNWFLAFLITRTFNNLVSAIGGDITFYFFALMSLTSCFFVYYCVPETKGKSLHEIQEILGRSE